MSDLSLKELRTRLAAEGGRRTWKSIDELAGTPEFLEFLHKEFPRQAAPLDGEIDRRQFLKLMSASLALAGLSACTRQPTEKVVPYVRVPEEVVPGEPLQFATARPLSGYATGILVESHVGRPTKIEGNELHPASLGSTDALAQAAILTLYDPDRAQVVRHVDEIVPWSQFDQAMASALEVQAARQGTGLRVLTDTVTSPTLAAQLRALLARNPGARWHQWEPAARDNALAGAKLAFGAPHETIYRFDAADVVLSLDADFLGGGPALARYARDFAARRAMRGGREMNRLYVVEPTPSTTGAKADHRLPLRARDVEVFARALAAELGVATPASPSAPKETATSVTAYVQAVAADLRAHGGSSLVLAGDAQPPVVHALAHAMNAALGNLGKTAVVIEPVQAEPVEQLASLRELVADMRAGRVELLLILGGNPVYDAPADLDFAGALEQVGLRVHLSLYDDETSRLCHWHLPESHFLESWSDARAYDGTATILQPLIAPLYGGRSAHEVLAGMTQAAERSGYEIVRATWKARLGAADFERVWQRALHDGIVPNTAAAPANPRVRRDWPTLPPPSAPAASPPPADAMEIVFRLDPNVYDGRFANNGWLQELPRPLSKITWDNVALIAPADAERLEIGDGDVLELSRAGKMVRAPAWIAPGQAAGSVTVSLGYGRTRAGRVGDGVGFDAYAVRTSAEPWFAADLTIARAGERHAIACTQTHHSLEGRDIVRGATLAEYRAEPDFAQKIGHAPAPGDNLYPGWSYDGHAWGMAIDLNACIGCNACVVACQAENNIPVVGKDQVSRGREMQWIRIDRYFTGDLDAPETDFQPMLCQHCEQAPCEVVCPVNATVHDSEGLNVMVYNRCVGTRYCSNNCPYKVRRFNFYLYSDWHTESLKLQRNPDVTVRSRGVMEKCTYCVQRISAGRIAARKDGRELRDGEVVTACQQVCPADAIVFGDQNDPSSRVAQLKRDPRNYSVLAELNTRPRTTYLAAVRNPNPALVPATPAGGAHGGHASAPSAGAHATAGAAAGATAGAAAGGAIGAKERSWRRHPSDEMRQPKGAADLSDGPDRPTGGPHQEPPTEVASTHAAPRTRP